MSAEHLAGKAILDGNTLDLNLDILRKSLDSDAASCRLVSAEVLLINAVHASEIAHIGKENSGLDDAVEGRSGSLEDGGEVLEDSLGTLLNGSGEDIAVLIGRDLPGDEDHTIGLNSLGL